MQDNTALIVEPRLWKDVRQNGSKGNGDKSSAGRQEGSKTEYTKLKLSWEKLGERVKFKYLGIMVSVNMGMEEEVTRRFHNGRKIGKMRKKLQKEKQQNLEK